MIKIAMFCDNANNTGGIYSHCVSLKALLEATGEYKVDLYSLIDCKKVWLAHIYNEKQLCEALKKDDYDFVHIHGFITLLPHQVMKCYKRTGLKVPVIYTPHAHPFYTLNHPKINRCFFKLFVKPVFKKVQKVVSINKEDFAFFSTMNNNVVTIPHWKKFDTAQAVEKTASDVKKVLFVGRNDSNKNLKALYSLPADKYQVICVTNSKPDREDFVYKTNISEEELTALYKECDVTAVPSRYEAFSLAALESLAVGTPVLASDRVRIADFISQEKGLVVFDYNKPEQVQEKLDIAIKQKVDVDYIKAFFSPEKALSSYKEIFKK